MLSILSYLRDGDPLLAIIVILSRCFVVFCCMPVHELSHAYAAYKLGDDTAKLKGRITLNPFAHLDLLGTIMIFLFGIGYASPVPVSVRRLKHPRRDMALISLAGPASNLLMSFVSSFIACAVMGLSEETLVTSAVSQFFMFSASVNASLAVFNLIPIPPLDGSRVLTSILPDKAYFKLMQYEKYIMIGLMVLLFTGVLNGVVSVLSSVLLNIVSIIPRSIFHVSF